MALNNLQGLICHKTLTTKQPIKKWILRFHNLNILCFRTILQLLHRTLLSSISIWISFSLSFSLFISLSLSLSLSHTHTHKYMYISSSSSSCRPGYPWPSLATSPCLQGYIPYPHRAAVCMFELVVLLLLGNMWGSIGIHHLWARPCFSSSVLHVWFIKLA